MHRRTFCGWMLVVMVLVAVPARAQVAVANALADLTALRSKVGSPDTRTRVDATHRVWSIALAQADSSVKLMALDLMREPINSEIINVRSVRCRLSSETISRYCAFRSASGTPTTRRGLPARLTRW